MNMGTVAIEGYVLCTAVTICGLEAITVAASSCVVSKEEDRICLALFRLDTNDIYASK